MISYANASKRAAERACNVGETERQTELRLAKDVKRAAEINEWFAANEIHHMRVEFGGDPRGCCGTLHIDGVRGDGWGDGFPIY